MKVMIHHPRFSQYLKTIGDKPAIKQSHYKGLHKALTGITTKAIGTRKKMQRMWHRLSPEQRKTLIHLAAMAVI